MLAKFTNETVEVELVGEASTERYSLRFAKPDMQELEAVDRALDELAGGHLLTRDTIDRFLSRTANLRSVRDYRAGIATYLFGVLARERSSDSGLDQHQYREKFDEAVEYLDFFDRGPANAICDLVSFHFNHFNRVIDRNRSPRLVRASRILRRCLQGELLPPGDDEPPLAEFDATLADALIEEALNLVLALTSASASDAARVAAEAEDALVRHEPFDQFKLRIVATEAWLRAGNSERARQTMSEVRHHPDAEVWAATVMDRSG